MYPPRSQKQKKGNRASKRRRRTAWAWTNAALLLLVTAMLTYYFIDENDKKAAAPPSGQEAAAPVTASGGTEDPQAVQASVPSQTEEPAATAPLPTAKPLPSPSPRITPSATVDPDADEVTSASPEASQVSEPTATPSPTEAAAVPTPKKTEVASDGNGTDPVSGLPPENAGKGGTVKISFGGDVIFSGKAGELLEQKGYAYSYSGLDGLFKKDDLSILNLETPITTGGTGAANKKYVFKGAPKALDALKSAGIDAVNLANNHTLDQGEEGLLDTLKHLNARGIPHVGAGKNSEEAFTAEYFERNGIKIALLGFTRVMPTADWQAGAKKPGLASVYDSRTGLKAIADAKKKADLVIVIVHWGKERIEQFDSTQQSLGHSFIDAGADLVMGGHPHVLQGIEPYKGKWIAYSTGNFIFTRSTVPATWETAVFQAECSAKGQCSMKLKPMHAELARPVPMNAQDGQKLLKKVEALSSGRVSISSDGQVKQAGTSGR